jgi:hypothetical protein
VSQDPDADALEVMVRYRPSADVLSASVPTANDSVVHRDEPDTDTVVEWVRRPDGRRMMVGAQVLFASARAKQGKLGHNLPAAFASLVTTGFANDDESDHVSTLALESNSMRLMPDELLLADDLSLPGDQSLAASPPPRATAVVTAALCTSLDGLVDALVDSTPHADAGPTDQLAQALEELADTLDHGEGLPAPGAAAAAQAAVRGGIPLTASERRTLAHALDNLDDPDLWPTATTQLNALAALLAGQKPAQ